MRPILMCATSRSSLQVGGNLFHRIHTGAAENYAGGISYLGDGVVYVSGVGTDPITGASDANIVADNVFLEIPAATGAPGIAPLELIYADGFGGVLRIERNAIVDAASDNDMQARRRAMCASLPPPRPPGACSAGGGAAVAHGPVSN